MHIKRLRKLPALGILAVLYFHCNAQVNVSPNDSIKSRQLYAEGIELGLKNKPEKALVVLKQATEIRKRLYGEHHMRLSGPYIGMAIQYKNLHQLDSAYHYYLLAEQIYLKNLAPDDIRFAVLYANLGSYFRMKGNISEAIRYNERAVQLYGNSQENSGPNHLTTIYNLALCYFSIDREEEALRISLEYMNKGGAESRIQFKSLVASIYTFYDKFDKADACHREMIRDIIREFGEDDMKLGDEYFYYAEFLNKSFRHDSAFAYLKKAETVYRKFTNIRSETGYVYKATADAWAGKKISSSTIEGFQSEKRRNLEQAIQFYRKALETFNPSLPDSGPDPDNIMQGTFPVPTLSILRDLGTCFKELSGLADLRDRNSKIYNLTQAVGYLSSGSELIKYIRTRFISEESKLRFNELQQSVFRLAVETAYDLYSLTSDSRWAEVALVNSERNKATSLFDKITENRSRESGLIPDSLLQTESNFNNALAYFREKLYDETQKSKPDPLQVTDLEEKIFDNEQKINRLREYLEKNFHDYYRIKYEMNSVTFRSIQKTLKRNEVLLAYSLVPPDEAKEGAFYLFAVSRSDFRFMKQPFSQDDRRNVTRLHNIISDPRFLSITKREFAEYCQSAANLYGLLISPVSAFIRNKQVVVVPDGIFHYIPFESLLTSEVSVSDIHFHDLPYFLLENPVRYSYSAELLRNNTGSQVVRNKRAAAFSPEYPRFSLVGDDTIRLTQIPGIYEEVNYLKRKMKTSAFSGTDATESNFRKIAGKVAVLHLATHTLINDSVPMYSRLAFFPEEPDSVTNDGWLTLSDIYNLRLKAGMTVLSACHTGTGNLRKGEGIMSLARGFLYAGSQSVILTLWEVEDQAATKIMKEFYRNLKFGKRKDSALRNAKIKYISGADPVHAHPHIWLSYIMIGNPEPLFKNYMTWLFPVMIVMILLLSFELFHRKRAKERIGK